MKYQLYLNVEQDEKGRLIGFMDGYQEGHKMDLAWAGELDGYDEHVNKHTDLGAAEELFHLFNMDHPAGYRNRSLSVGDVVVLRLGTPDTCAFACERVGFRRLERFLFEVKNATV